MQTLGEFIEQDLLLNNIFKKLITNKARYHRMIHVATPRSGIRLCYSLERKDKYIRDNLNKCLIFRIKVAPNN